jgi:hypothetical protein
VIDAMVAPSNSAARVDRDARARHRSVVLRAAIARRPQRYPHWGCASPTTARLRRPRRVLAELATDDRITIDRCEPAGVSAATNRAIAAAAAAVRSAITTTCSSPALAWVKACDRSRPRRHRLQRRGQARRGRSRRVPFCKRWSPTCCCRATSPTCSWCAPRCCALGGLRPARRRRGLRPPAPPGEHTDSRHLPKPLYSWRKRRVDAADIGKPLARGEPARSTAIDHRGLGVRRPASIPRGTGCATHRRPGHRHRARDRVELLAPCIDLLRERRPPAARDPWSTAGATRPRSRTSTLDGRVVRYTTSTTPDR